MAFARWAKVAAISCVDARRPDDVRGLPERQWNNGEKFWTVPVEHVVATVDLLRPHGFALDAETLRLYEARRETSPDHLTVSQLNLQVREAVLKAFPVPLWVVGEVSGFNRNAHKKWVGFQLVERNSAGEIVAQVEAVLSPDDRQSLEAKLQREGAPFRLEDEIQVRLLVTVDLRADWGRYQVAVRDIDVAYTLGEVARRREEILRKLTAEGVIERNRSLPLPDLPLRVGVVTSLGSDAYHDVLRTFRESGYAFAVTVHGARVQGPSTEASVLNALDWFRDRAGEFDLVLICRGGGSRTDLAWFDSEALGRAVALFPLPVVVGIGHEEDRCVLDEVGWRQKTPTAAAQSRCAARCAVPGRRPCKTACPVGRHPVRTRIRDGTETGRHERAGGGQMGQAAPVLVLRDGSGRDQLPQRSLHRPHPEAAACLYLSWYLVGLPLTDEIADSRRGDEDFEGGHPRRPVALEHEGLGQDALERSRELDADLVLLVGREDVDDAVDCLRGVARVQGRQDQVACLGRGHGDGDSLKVAHLADENDVRVLTQGRP